MHGCVDRGLPNHATVNHGVGRYVSEQAHVNGIRRVEYLEDIVYGSPAPLPTHAPRLPVRRPYGSVLPAEPEHRDGRDQRPDRAALYTASPRRGVSRHCGSSICFAVRATDPREMFKMSAADVVGEENDCAILEAAAEADTFVAAWGNHGRHLDRDLAVMTLLHDVSVMCLGVTQKGMPAHPLYQRRDLEPARYGGREIPI